MGEIDDDKETAEEIAKRYAYALVRDLGGRYDRLQEFAEIYIQKALENAP